MEGDLLRSSRNIFFSLWRKNATRPRASSFVRFLDHTQRHTRVGRTPLDEGSARRSDLYLVTLHSQETRPCLRRDVFCTLFYFIRTCLFYCAIFCLYDFTYNTQRNTSMPPAGFESAIPASDRPQTLALHRSAIGIGRSDIIQAFCMTL